MRVTSCRARLALFALLLAVTPAIAPAAAAEEETTEALSGTLKHIHDTKVVTLGYRESSIPFSYSIKGSPPIGYSIDLCNEIVDEISNTLGLEIAVAYKSVTSETRIPLLLSGAIDLECGSTTSNFERKKQVAFSPVFFVAGTKLLVKDGSGIESYRDLKGKSVAVTAGTTNEAAVRAISDRQKLGIEIVKGSDHAQSFALLQDGKVAAFATDDVLLYGLLATDKNAAGYRVVGDYLSYDPYGLMFRKNDPAFAELVERRFLALAQSREIVQLYDRWFLKRLPGGERLGLPMSPQLEEIFRVLGVPE
jgi:glutamate/aspartate transport system substrate-binding protein